MKLEKLEILNRKLLIKRSYVWALQGQGNLGQESVIMFMHGWWAPPSRCLSHSALLACEGGERRVTQPWLHQKWKLKAATRTKNSYMAAAWTNQNHHPQVKRMLLVHVPWFACIWDQGSFNAEAIHEWGQKCGVGGVQGENFPSAHVRWYVGRFIFAAEASQPQNIQLFASLVVWIYRQCNFSQENQWRRRRPGAEGVAPFYVCLLSA